MNLFSKHSPNQGWESTHRLHLSHLSMHFTCPSIIHQVGGISIYQQVHRIRFIISEIQAYPVEDDDPPTTLDIDDVQPVSV